MIMRVHDADALVRRGVGDGEGGDAPRGDVLEVEGGPQVPRNRCNAGGRIPRNQEGQPPVPGESPGEKKT
eukprot:2720280-Pyramimonas_sp.AAC.1